MDRRAQGLVLVAVALLGTGSAQAATYEVNRASDKADRQPGDNRCDVKASAGDTCTLRAAIEESNIHGGADAIKFAISGGGVKTITPATALPTITDRVKINGYSQPGASANTLAVGDNANPLIELVGSPGFAGLTLDADESKVKGLVIEGFGDGIAITSNQNRIRGNFIGTDATGTADLGATRHGVLVDGDANVIGGAAPKDRNLITGHGSNGIDIGGVEPAAANQVLGNYIGTDRNGAVGIGNENWGVHIGNAQDTTVGGLGAGEANRIASNGLTGVAVRNAASTGNRIFSNSIFDNFDPGIDLLGDGIATNDPDDPDTGANNRQNYPVITKAQNNLFSTIIQGTLDSTPSTEFLLQFFSNTANVRQGQIFVGGTSATTDSNGDASFSFPTPGSVPDGRYVTATATDPAGNTSEIGAPRIVEPPVIEP